MLPGHFLCEADRASPGRDAAKIPEIQSDATSRARTKGRHAVPLLTAPADEAGLAMDRHGALHYRLAMSFITTYERGIDALVGLCPGPDKFAHVSAGLAFWVLGAILMRRPLHSAGPLAVIVILEMANEYVDYLAYGSWRWPDTIGDAIATWFWPFAITLAMRSFPKLRAGR